MCDFGANLFLNLRSLRHSLRNWWWCDGTRDATHLPQPFLKRNHDNNLCLKEQCSKQSRKVVRFLYHLTDGGGIQPNDILAKQTTDAVKAADACLQSVEQSLCKWGKSMTNINSRVMLCHNLIWQKHGMNIRTKHVEVDGGSLPLIEHYKILTNHFYWRQRCLHSHARITYPKHDSAASSYKAHAFPAWMSSTEPLRTDSRAPKTSRFHDA